MGRLSGKVAIITGGAQGVGLGIAGAFAREGAMLLLTGRTEAKLHAAIGELEAVGSKVATCVGDVSKRADAERAAAAALAAYGRIDILVNNAQNSVPGTALEDTTEDVLRLTVESGLYGTIQHMQAVFPHMRGHGGSIINLGSREGIFGGMGFGAYAATKEGIRGVSRVAAREWGQHAIRVNVICPAALTPPAIHYLDSHPEEAAMYRREIALGRFGDPAQDIGPVAVFLASEDSRYVTGQTINADGGQMML